MEFKMKWLNKMDGNLCLCHKPRKRLTPGIKTLIFGTIVFSLIAVQSNKDIYSSAQADPAEHFLSPQLPVLHPPNTFTPDTVYDPNDAYYIALLNSFEKYPEDKTMFISLFTSAKNTFQTKSFDMAKMNAILNQNPAYMSVLDIMRCIPYARLGYKFKRPFTERIFQCFPWYQPSQVNAQTLEKRFTPLEKSNIAAIITFEKQHWNAH